MYLGNLSVDEFVKRLGIKIQDEDKRTLEKYRIDKAEIPFDEKALHIFDIPFAIHISEPLFQQVLNMLKKYDFEPRLEVVKIYETEEQKQKKLEREREEQRKEDLRNDPNKVWHVQYQCLVPVKVRNRDLFYECFVNVYIKGFYNIPDSIDGVIEIYKDESGVHGHFTYEDSSDYVMGLWFTSQDGVILGEGTEEDIFEKVKMPLEKAIQNYKTIKGANSCRTVYYD